jgi:hypothetical protein
MTLHVNLLLSVRGTVQRSERDYADSRKHHGAVKAANLKERQQGEVTQFGIIRNAALYAGHGPATVKLFKQLWEKGLPST